MGHPAAPAELDAPLFQRLAAHRFTTLQLLAIDAAAVLLLLVVFEVLMSRQPAKVSGTGWSAAGWAAYLVAAGATLLRRRWPRGALAMVLCIAVLTLSLRAGGPIVFYVAAALYSFVAVSSRQIAFVITGLAVSVILAAVVVGQGDQLAQAAIAGATLLLLGWLAGENTRASRVYAAHQAERAAEKADAAAAEHAEQVRRAMADERAQIARELHDIVAHAMSVIAVRSGVARMVIDTDPGQARAALTIIETTTRRSLHEMRLLVGVLRDAQEYQTELSPVPGLHDLDRLVTAAAEAGVAADVRIEGKVRGLSSSAELSAYRIVQEALTNVVRHAGPTHAHVRVCYRPLEVIIEVVDEGPRGPSPPPVSPAGSGHGLIGMRERAALFGGELTAGPCRAGFRVKASLPLADLQGDEPLDGGAAGRDVPTGGSAR